MPPTKLNKKRTHHFGVFYCDVSVFYKQILQTHTLSINVSMSVFCFGESLESAIAISSDAGAIRQKIFYNISETNQKQNAKIGTV